MNSTQALQSKLRSNIEGEGFETSPGPLARATPSLCEGVDDSEAGQAIKGAVDAIASLSDLEALFWLVDFAFSEPAACFEFTGWDGLTHSVTPRDDGSIVLGGQSVCRVDDSPARIMNALWEAIGEKMSPDDLSLRIADRRAISL